MTFGSVCSGIEAASVAWKPLGWTPAFYSEIEPFPCAVLKERHNETPNLGDMTLFKDWPDYAIDVLIGGTPCQSFSVAGLRKGLDDPRGNLTLTFLGIVQRYRPEWVVWENVPGVLSDKTGAFGAFLGGLGQLGYGWSYRILDAQYFRVAQRRRRVFVVGHSGGCWQRAAAVLFERESLCGNPPPRREAGKRVAPTLEGRAGRSGGNNFATSGGLIDAESDVAGTQSARTNGGGGLGTDLDCAGGVVADWPHEVAGTLDAHYGDKMGLEDQHIFNQKASRFVRGDNHLIGSFKPNQGAKSRGIGFSEDVSPTLEAAMGGNNKPAIAIQSVNTPREKKQNGIGVSESETMYSLTSRDQHGVATQSSVRRLTPRECERLQGFPDDYTRIPWRGKAAADCPDGPRYKATGNSMAVPVIKWIGERIAKVSSTQPANSPVKGSAE